jgi:peptide/nickel transport system ATP-binding protein
VACHWAEQIRDGRIHPHHVDADMVDEAAGAAVGTPEHAGSVTEILGR